MARPRVSKFPLHTPSIKPVSDQPVAQEAGDASMPYRPVVSA